MSNQPKVVLKNVSKKFILHERKIDALLEILSLNKNKKSFYALRNISVSVNQGETIGIIGINGSGKSTMSNILAQVVPPTTGEINVKGETSLIAISVGLNNNLTGMENIELKCLMHGMKREEIERVTPLIVEFADIGDFINQPVKNYSSGMRSRLGFAISAHTDPDVMIIDEALSVGDQTFYDKCINKMNEFKAQGKTIFFISHSASQIRSFCDKVIWLHYGEIVEFGPSRSVINKYKEFIQWFNGLSDKEKKDYKKEQLSLQQIELSNESDNGFRTRSVSKKKKKQRKNIFPVGLVVLFTLFFLSAFLMLFNTHSIMNNALELIQNEHNDMGDSKSEEVETIKESNKVVNKEGFIGTKDVKVFKTSELGNELATLDFMDNVYVKSKVGKTYEIIYNNTQGYIEVKDIYFPEEGLEQSNLTITDFLQGLPVSFQNAYEYYLIFLNENKDNIENKLNGKTDEGIDTKGNKYLRYDSVEYQFNNDNYSDAIVVKEFTPENVDMERILQSASYKSFDGELIYIASDEYEIILDLHENTFTIKTAS
ncbi:ABC transporter ATP-binding protein [Cytobacillus firmus]|uniref:ABC transporter ATP-binding protein n=1 Tax=Cytobacillus firmus TaxID=1399 RepID=UPI001CFE9049|nr:ATP-binding cassette domain-containing protein [Cytobacillus firmus]